MTTLFPTEVECFVCGHVAEQTVVGSTNMRGSSDLDGRPPKMARSNLQYGVQACPSCGYCAPEISKGTELVKEIVASAAYQDALGSEQMPSLASRFVCCALIELAGEARKPYLVDLFLSAAWACDDAEDAAAAADCRLRAAAALEAAIEGDEIHSSDPQGVEWAILADLFRRTGSFGEVERVVTAAESREKDEVIDTVLRFERVLAVAGDIGVYTVEDAAGR